MGLVKAKVVVACFLTLVVVVLVVEDKPINSDIIDVEASID